MLHVDAALGQGEKRAELSSGSNLVDARAGEWARWSVAQRLRVLRAARHCLAACTNELCASISSELPRNASDTMVAEVLPLLAAGEFLERAAARILATRKLGRRGLPMWLTGVRAEVRRVPFGRVLVIGPSNYPLLLPGVQTLQALAAGNAVIWKPGRGGAAVAKVFARVMLGAGVPQEALRVTDEDPAEAVRAIETGVDKVFFTGSEAAGQAVLRQCAERVTPCVVELSGCDAVFVLPSADVRRTIKALSFGMRLNGSATCMAPRRVVVVDATGEREKEFVNELVTALGWVPAVTVSESTRTQLAEMLAEARSKGAEVMGEVGTTLQPVVVRGVTADMRLAKTDVFAPVLMVMRAGSIPAAMAANEACPFALTASVFGDEREALEVADRVTAGTVTVNDLIVPTADPRVPFGGRKKSGFGTTRGREGLLEMTAVKVVSVRRGGGTRHYEPTHDLHEGMFGGLITAAHAGTWSERLRGVKRVVDAARRMRRS